MYVTRTRRRSTRPKASPSTRRSCWGTTPSTKKPDTSRCHAAVRTIASTSLNNPHASTSNTRPSRSARQSTRSTAALRVSHAQALAVDRGVDGKALERRMLDQDLHHLHDERQDLERIVGMKPHNPAADIRSLENSRDDLEYARSCQQERLDILNARHPIRHRRERTAERLSVESGVENLQRQLDSTEHALEVARGQQGAYDTYANKYGQELARLGVIGYEIEAKLERLVTGYRDDPPAYLAALGPYPYDSNKRWSWDDAARTVEQYRHQHHVTDQRQPLGLDEPTRLRTATRSRAAPAGRPRTHPQRRPRIPGPRNRAVVPRRVPRRSARDVNGLRVIRRGCRASGSRRGCRSPGLRHGRARYRR